MIEEASTTIITTDRVNKMDRMVDLHTHILPGVDDGARDTAETLEMARQAAGRQIRVVAATPHFLGMEWDQIKAETEKLRKLLADHQIDLMVTAGAELLIDPALIDLAKEEIPTYNDAGEYCLIEFPMQNCLHMLSKCFFRCRSKALHRSSPTQSGTGRSLLIQILLLTGLNRDV